jgi:hypothetical protein
MSLVKSHVDDPEAKLEIDETFLKIGNSVLGRDASLLEVMHECGNRPVHGVAQQQDQLYVCP